MNYYKICKPTALSLFGIKVSVKEEGGPERPTVYEINEKSAVLLEGNTPVGLIIETQFLFPYHITNMESGFWIASKRDIPTGYPRTIEIDGKQVWAPSSMKRLAYRPKSPIWHYVVPCRELLWQYQPVLVEAITDSQPYTLRPDYME